MGTPLLILLGALGGSLRGLIGLYNSAMLWQSARREFRLNSAEETQGPPSFRDYFDPLADSIAALLHTFLGAGAALLLGFSGQITGGYAAVVVGISAPALLTQLGNLQPISHAVSGDSTQSAPINIVGPPQVDTIVQRPEIGPSGPKASPERSAAGTE